MTQIASAPNQMKSQSRWRKWITREIVSLADQSQPRLWFWASWARLLPNFKLASVRAQFYRLAGCRIAPGVALLGRLTLIGQGKVAERLSIGGGSIIAPFVTFGLDAEISLGCNVSISPNAILYTGTHALGFGSRRMNPTISPKPIVIGDGVWVGMNALILPGVTLGQGCVVSAGAVVSQDVPPNMLVAGNPATVQQTLPFGSR